MLKQGSTLILKTTVLLIGLVALALCLFVLPIGLRGDSSGYYRPIILGMYVTAIPFFIALHQAMKLLGSIDTHAAFSNASVQILKNIRNCALTISALYAVGLPYIYTVADKDDAPGVMAVGLIIVFASFVIATFAGVLQKLLKNALEIKSENDLTV
ncbi:MAG TPA: DUF2975 domain-containing protein [Patescibacteria group bacterium]